MLGLEKFEIDLDLGREENYSNEEVTTKTESRADAQPS